MKHINLLAIFLILSYSLLALTPDEENLFKAINEKNSDNVSSLLSKSSDIDINVLDSEGYTPLHRAVYNKDLNTINELLKNKDINVNSKLDIKVSINGWYLGGATPLILASYMGQTDIVKVLLDHDADIKAKDDIDGSMAIHMASANGNNDVIKLLLAKDSDSINYTDNRGNTPLHWAAMKDKPETVKLLMENGADLEAKDSDGWTPLHYASAFSSLETVKTLVDLGADKKIKTKDGNDALYYARRDDVKNYLAGDSIERDIPNDNNEQSDSDKEKTTDIEKETPPCKGEVGGSEIEESIIKEDNKETNENNELDIKQLELLIAVENDDIVALNTLINEGVNPNFKDDDGYSPLHIAIINNNLTSVETLLSYTNIDKEMKLPYETQLNNWYIGGATPLIVASYIGNPDIVYTLIQAGCDIKARDDIDGAMPIHVAAANGRSDAVVILLEKDNSLVNAEDNNGGDTPLHWAAMKNRRIIVDILLKYKPDAKIQNSDGNTALHYASMYADADIVKSLVKYDNSSVNVVNNEKMYPMHYAALENNSDALICLVKDGKADVNIKDSENDTPLHYAAAYGNIDSVMVLVEKCNADISIIDSEGNTAAQLASNNGYENIASYLNGDSKIIPENNDKFVLPEYHRKSDLTKKWW